MSTKTKTKTPATKTKTAKRPVKRASAKIASAKRMVRPTARDQRNTLLMSKIALKGLRMKDLAGLLGITYAALRNKVNRAREFKVSEVVKLREALGLTLEEVDTIFLAQ